MLYSFELRALKELRGTDLRLYVKLHVIGSALLLLRSDLRRLGKLLLVFYQAIYRQIAVAVIHNVVPPIDRIRPRVFICPGNESHRHLRYTWTIAFVPFQSTTPGEPPVLSSR
jgi:hypothetical protein